MKRKFTDIVKDVALVNLDFTLDKQDLDAQLNTLYEELKDKENGVYWFYQNLDKQIEMAREYQSKMNHAIKTMKYTQERLKKTVVESYTVTGKMPSHDVFNPMKVYEMGSVEVIDEDKIPKEYFVEKIEYRLDKKRVLQELKEGKEIPGVALRTKQHLRGLK